LRFELAQMYYYINIEITRSFSSFLIFYTPIYYIIDIKSAYKTSHENPHTAYAVCDDHPHAYWNPHFKLLGNRKLKIFSWKTSKNNREFLIYNPPCWRHYILDLDNQKSVTDYFMDITSIFFRRILSWILTCQESVKAPH
jgi:hypothetical protein